MIIKYVCDSQDEGKLLSALLRDRLEIYTATLRRLKAGGGIYLNGEPVHVRRTVHAADTVELDLSAAETPSEIPPEDMPLDIIYESDTLLAVNKPANTVVHPTCFHREGTLAAGIAGYYRAHGLNSGIHLINRLDLGTSGLLLTAKYGLVQERIRAQAEAGAYSRIYIGVLDIGPGPMPERGDNGVVDAPIARDRTSIIKRKVDPEGDRAVTQYTILAVDPLNRRALALFSLLTGRTHQIRVHMLHAGMPLTGDTLYNPANAPYSDSHQLLHHYRAAFRDPLTDEAVDLVCPAPAELTTLFPDEFENGVLKAGLPEAAQ